MGSVVRREGSVLAVWSNRKEPIVIGNGLCVCTQSSRCGWGGSHCILSRGLRVGTACLKQWHSMGNRIYRSLLPLRDHGRAGEFRMSFWSCGGPCSSMFRKHQTRRELSLIWPLLGRWSRGRSLEVICMQMSKAIDVEITHGVVIVSKEAWGLGLPMLSEGGED